MRELSSGLKSSLEKFNDKLQQKYQNKSNLTDQQLKKLIIQHLGDFKLIEELAGKELKEWTKNGPIVGVDGSVNTTGKVYPHYLTLLQALAKSTTEKEVIRHEIFSPLSEKDKEKIFRKLSKEGLDNAQEAAGKIKTSLLAALEVKVAYESIKQCNPQLIMMDGSLIRYYYQAEELWKELVDLALAEDVLLVGVIEEIATHQISKKLKEQLPVQMKEMYDRELLFGLLKKGEMLQFKPGIDFKPGLETVFLRSSSGPGVIGVDILKQQANKLEFINQVIYSLTPKEGRGIPIWLDMVDEEVRITNKMMELLLNNYLDPALKERLFHSKRKDRIY
ncbi:NurA domain-containing protein [Halobacteroides halobius DSM 5150]|uniref:NurA domain-containing protein n=1 Tax=Halobacteroides halobius (strain ATCC 35273 / DSM 5150 / MD-1) TaxID=748449 RepID=L0K6U3_HALHC|nr:DNA double-strand break repair nuclease NurA [Halobacteroides halobius]AGB40089.1 NurA domain-containing protein [Halobacteroides halobius DSM 5150]